MALPLSAMVCLRFVIVVFPDHTHLLFFIRSRLKEKESTVGFIGEYEEIRCILKRERLLRVIKRNFDYSVHET